MWLPQIGLLPIELLLSTIVEDYLAQSYCISYFSDVALMFKSSQSFTYIIPNEELITEQILNVSEIGCSDYVVRMKDPENFMIAFEKVVHIGKIRRSDRKIIILPHDKNVNDINLARNIFSMKETSFVANIIVILNNTSDSCEVFDLFTHKYEGADEEIMEPYYLDRWNSCTTKFYNQANLFPHDMKDLKGKLLRVATFSYKPYALLDIDSTIEPLGRDGIEVRIADEFCRWINCSVEIIREDIEQWGEIFENETGGVGVLGSVVEDQADMGLGALYSWYEEWRVMDFSSAGVRTAITCIAPTPRLLSSWEIPLMPFTWYLWIAVIVTFFYASFGLKIAQGLFTNSDPFLTVFGMMISQSRLEAVVHWKIRSVSGWLVIIALILASAYGAGLASTFTVPRYESSIDTVQDIVNRGMPWGATHDAWIFSLLLSNEPLIKQLLNQFQTHSFEELQKRSYTRSMAFSIEKLPAGYFAIGEYITEDAALDLMLMVEDFYYEHCVIMLRKSSPYTEKLNSLIGRLHQSGLLLAWETQVALKYLDYKVQVEVKLSRLKSDGGVTKSLSFSNVSGVFVIYTIGVTIAVAVLIGELIVKDRKLRNKSVSKLGTKVESAIS